MMQMAYLSFATRQFKRNLDENISNVLQTSRKHNQAHNITGQLLYRAGIFIQFLEGHREDVIPLVGRILLDNSRHENLKILLNQPMLERVFPEWSMAYKKIDDQSMDIVNSIIPWQKFLRATDKNVHFTPEKIIHLFEELKS